MHTGPNSPVSGHHFDNVRALFTHRIWTAGGEPQFEHPLLQSPHAAKLRAGTVPPRNTNRQQARFDFDEAISLVDHFFRSEHGADRWHVYAALQFAHAALIALLDANFVEGKRLSVEDGRAYRRAQLLALNQPPECFNEDWRAWFLPHRAGHTIFAGDEVLHPDLLGERPESLSQKEWEARDQRAQDRERSWEHGAVIAARLRRPTAAGSLAHHSPGAATQSTTPAAHPSPLFMPFPSPLILPSPPLTTTPAEPQTEVEALPPPSVPIPQAEVPVGQDHVLPVKVLAFGPPRILVPTKPPAPAPPSPFLLIPPIATLEMAVSSPASSSDEEIAELFVVRPESPPLLRPTQTPTSSPQGHETNRAPSSPTGYFVTIPDLIPTRLFDQPVAGTSGPHLDGDGYEFYDDAGNILKFEYPE